MQEATDQDGIVNEKAHDEIESNAILRFLKNCITSITEQNLSGYAQMVAYNLLFATAPVLMVVVAGAAMVTRAANSDMQNPAQPVLQWMQENLPADAADFLNEPIERAVNADPTWIFSIGGLLALWGARGAVAAIIRGLNMAYGVGRDPRSFIEKNAIAIGMTLSLVVLLGVGGLFFALGSDFGKRVAGDIGLEDVWTTTSDVLRYPLIVAISVLVVMTLHRFGPAQHYSFKAYLPGAVFTIIAMYIATFALAFWFAQSTGFAGTYGIFGSVLAFILWLYVMGFVILIGGVINAALQREKSGQLESSSSRA